MKCESLHHHHLRATQHFSWSREYIFRMKCLGSHVFLCFAFAFKHDNHNLIKSQTRGWWCNAKHFLHFVEHIFHLIFLIILIFIQKPCRWHTCIQVKMYNIAVISQIFEHKKLIKYTMLGKSIVSSCPLSILTELNLAEPDLYLIFQYDDCWYLQATSQSLDYLMLTFSWTNVLIVLIMLWFSDLLCNYVRCVLWMCTIKRLLKTNVIVAGD